MKLSKSVPPAAVNSWVKPQLVKLGQIGDVAGNMSINANGLGNVLKS